MSRKTAMFIMVVIVGLVGVGLWVRLTGIPMERMDKTSPTSVPTLTPFPVPELTLGTWFAYWDEINSFEIVKERIEALDFVHPILYRILPTGRLGRYEVRNREEVLNFMRERDMDIIPQIGDEFDYERVSLLLYDNEVQAGYIDGLITEAGKESFAGWDFNIETIQPSDRDAFSAFVRNAAGRLHENNLRVVVTVYAKDKEYPNAPSYAHDYHSIAAEADQIQLMVYGFSNESTSPGGQAPLAWYREVLDFATASVPRDKLVISLSTHGYMWSPGQNTALTYPEVSRYLTNSKVNEYIKPADSSMVLQTDIGEIWYESGETIAEKIRIARSEYGIGTFMLWRVGTEDPALWDEMQNL